MWQLIITTTPGGITLDQAAVVYVRGETAIGVDRQPAEVVIGSGASVLYNQNQ